LLANNQNHKPLPLSPRPRALAARATISLLAAGAAGRAQHSSISALLATRTSVAFGQPQHQAAATPPPPSIATATAAATTTTATMQRSLAPASSSAFRAYNRATASLRAGRRTHTVVVRAGWGDPVEFRKAKLASTSAACKDGGLRTLVVQLPDAAARSFTAAGQYVQIKPDEESKPAYIALANAPEDVSNNGGLVELLVKPQPGATAEQLCALSEGSELLVSDAQGKGFPVDRVPAADYPTVLLFATGSGISPVRSLIESGALAGRPDVRLFFGTRSPEHTAYADLASGAWAKEHGVKVHHVYSEGEGGMYVQDAFAKAGGLNGADPAKTAAVLVGQKQMAEALRESLFAAGVAAECVLTNF
jgi:ferredoxin-NADP reductase